MVCLVRCATRPAWNQSVGEYLNSSQVQKKLAADHPCQTRILRPHAAMFAVIVLVAS